MNDDAILRLDLACFCKICDCFDILNLRWYYWYVNMKIWLRMYMIVKVLLWNCDNNEFVNI